jgi:hypothetical protein
MHVTPFERQTFIQAESGVDQQQRHIALWLRGEFEINVFTRMVKDANARRNPLGAQTQIYPVTFVPTAARRTDDMIFAATGSLTVNR